MQLDRDAALRSTSWGKFQIMGDPFRRAGYLSVDAFVEAEKRSVQDQLAALVAFIKAEPAMQHSLQQKTGPVSLPTTTGQTTGKTTTT